MKHKRAYQYRCYPTPSQRQTLARTFGCARFVYNWALRWRRDAYRQRGEHVFYRDTSAALTQLKQQPETSWLGEVACVPPQQALRHLDKAFRNFFEERAKYPTFKKKHGRQSAEYTTSAFTWDGNTLCAGQDERTAADPLESPVAQGRQADHHHRHQGYGRAVLRLLPGGRGHPAPAGSGHTRLGLIWACRTW